MKPLTGKIFIPAFLIIIFYTAGSDALAKNLRIEGLKIFNSRELIRVAGLESFEKNPLSAEKAAKAIEEFYRKNRYTLVKIHVVEDSEDALILFVDEGKLARVVVHENNYYYALKIKQAVVIPSRIYNSEIVENIRSGLNNKFGFSRVRFELVKTGDYSGNVFQINRDLDMIQIPEMKISFFSRYPAEYELHIYIDPAEAERGFSIKKEGWGFDVDYHYPSLFIPVFSIYNNDLLLKKDSLETDFSAGFDPGLSGYLKIPMKNTFRFPPARRFIEVTAEYRFMPVEDSIFTPVLSGRLYYSNSGRKDLGLTSYQYLNIRGLLAPGITPLENLNIYAGTGCEWINIFDSEIDYSADEYIQINDGWASYPFIEARVLFDPIPLRLGTRVEKNYVLRLTHYFNGENFSEIEMKGAHDIEFSNLSILSFRLRGCVQSSDVPFHHQAAVSGRYFKGFSGRSYYSNMLAAFSAEYRFSVYQDYVYTGFFCDWTVFKAEGFLISGTKNGLAAGPTARFLVYDQFEFTLYYGWDRLLPDGLAGKNFQMKLSRRW